MKNKRYDDELKLRVVEEYLAGVGMMELVRKYELADKGRIMKWRDKYLEYGCFPDGRGKMSTGRPRKVDISLMTREQYIQFLEMENDILKRIRSLSSSQQR